MEDLRSPERRRRAGFNPITRRIKEPSHWIATDFTQVQVSIKLQPNQKNGGDHPLAIGQVIPAGAYRGQKSASQAT